ncbi:hypothetical protein N7495_007253 [Penicillium taxi]|uniref:uncharacterized protein n=1 Tax=Penicillium taxi TaxID=168475 RepID=UPI0025451A38|nr:uncharacterized protein N7495_007253 [Penicillium taxi]KAJ5895562.1 hypothetical protein N7495_007253 [Penicillium taxi]
MVQSPRLAPDLYTHAPGKPTLMSMNSPQTRMATFQRTPEFDLGPEHVFQRPMMGSEPMHYEGEQTNYNMSPEYLHSNAPPGVFMDYETASWNPKHWDSVVNSRSAGNGGMYPEPEQSPFYMLPSQVITNDLSQSVAVSSPDAPGSDRILPTPTCRSQQVPSITVPNDRLSRTLSRDNSTAGQRHLALTSECAADIYGYTSTEKSKRGDGGNGGDSRYPGATLMSGLPYTRVPHRDMPANPFAFNMIPDALSEYQRVVENVHRPVEPLRNQGAY